jgi:hypothetical protein
MTEQAQGMSQSQDSSSPGAAPSQTASAPSPAPSQTSEEKTFRQSEVNNLIGREKARAIEEYKRLQTEQPQYAQQKYGDSGNSQAAYTPPAQNSESEMRRLAAEEAQKHFERVNNDIRAKYETEQAQKTVQNFWSKISTGKEKYQDFDTVTSDIEYARFPNVVQLLAEHVDNADDMLYEMGKDRFKMAQLEQLAHMSPNDAVRQAKRMSQSLKDNEAARRAKVPNAPLSQMRPSNTGTDNGVMGVKDYRAKWKV